MGRHIARLAALALACVWVTACGAGGAAPMPSPRSGNSAPLFDAANMPPASAQENVPYLWQASATDADGDLLTYSLFAPSAPSMTVTAAGLVSWTPPPGAAAAPHEISLVASDGQVFVALDWSITVAPAANGAPEFLLPAVPVPAVPVPAAPGTTAIEGTLYSYTAMAEDPDGDPITFTLASSPAGMTVSVSSVPVASGLVEWTPTSAQINVQHTITLIASDDKGNTAAQTWTIAALPAPNQLPAFDATLQPATLARENHIYSFDAAASDPDGDAIEFSLTEFPAGMTVNASSGLVQWSPTGAQKNLSHGVKLTASDGKGGTATLDWSVAVDPNRAPEFTGAAPDSTARVGIKYSYTVTATDPDSDGVSFQLAAFSSGNMTLTVALFEWTPEAADAGVARSVTIEAVDGYGGTTALTWSITAGQNQPPVFSNPNPPPVTAQLGLYYEYYAGIAEDPEGDSVTCVLVTSPAGMVHFPYPMSGNRYTQRVSWTPDPAQVGNSYDVNLTATDAYGAVTELRWTISVAEGWTIEDHGDMCGRSSMAFDAAGHAHIVYMDLSTSPHSLKYLTDAPSGTWNEPDLVDSINLGTVSEFYLSAAIDEDGALHAVYRDPNSGSAMLKYATNANPPPGSEWYVEVISDVSSHTDPAIAIDDARHAHVIYQDNVASTLHYANNVNITRGQAWNNPGALASGFNHSIAIDSANTVHVGYNSKQGSIHLFQYSRYESGTWSTPETIHNAGANSGANTGPSNSPFAISLALDSNELVHVAYCYPSQGYSTPIRYDHRLAYATRDANGIWASLPIDLNILSSLNLRRGVSLVLDRDDHAHIAHTWPLNGKDSQQNTVKAGVHYLTNQSCAWTIKPVDVQRAMRYPTIGLDVNGNANFSYRIDTSPTTLRIARW